MLCSYVCIISVIGTFVLSVLLICIESQGYTVVCVVGVVVALYCYNYTFVSECETNHQTVKLMVPVLTLNIYAVYIGVVDVCLIAGMVYRRCTFVVLQCCVFAADSFWWSLWLSELLICHSSL